VGTAAVSDRGYKRGETRRDSLAKSWAPRTIMEVE
jgi:hypothetical protein